MSSSSSYGDPGTRERILEATEELISRHGAQFKLSDVASAASVSRQAVYLHFGDRSGLLLSLVQHIDARQDLAHSLAGVHAAEDGAALLEAAMRLNTTFWRNVHPIARVLEAAQHQDDALGRAWRDRMQFRQTVFRRMIEELASRGELAGEWSVEDAAGILYGVTHFDTWRELVIELGWSDTRYVESMSRVLRRALLR